MEELMFPRVKAMCGGLPGLPGEVEEAPAQGNGQPFGPLVAEGR